MNKENFLNFMTQIWRFVQLRVSMLKSSMKAKFLYDNCYISVFDSKECKKMLNLLNAKYEFANNKTIDGLFNCEQ